MENVENKNRGRIVIPLLLTLIIIVLVCFILVEHSVIKIPGFDFLVIKEQKETAPLEAQLENNNANVKNILKTVHNPGEEIDLFIFRDGGGKISAMSEEYKFALASNLMPDLTPANTGSYAGYINEDDVKNAYESLFGTGTYHETKSFKLRCNQMTYDISNRIYTTNVLDCGNPTTPLSLIEEVTSAIKTKDTLTIKTAVVFYDASQNKMFKDYTTKEELKLTTSETLTEETIKNYITSNTTSLQQYTYTFKIGTDGFYYYQGVERTNA